MHAVVVYLSVRLSVCACVSVTLRYCVKTAKRIIIIIIIIIIKLIYRAHFRGMPQT